MATQRMLEARDVQMLDLKWRSRYFNQQLILFVGEGDFSFSSSRATALGAATNIVATSLDSRGKLLEKYGKVAELNTLNLSHRGALVLHEFDACKMAMSKQRNRLGGFQSSFFHLIVFNFPHAGFFGREDDPHVIEKHKKLVKMFFANAREMLLPGGQIHVSHKLGAPYESWMLKEQAQVSGLTLVDRVPFRRKHYPGYQNCRGDGSRAGESFNVGRADTYIFAARIEEPRASSLNVREPLGMSSTVLAPLQSFREKAVHKAGASQVISLQHVVADKVSRPKKLQLGKKKMKNLETLKSALPPMNLENSPTSLSCTTKEPPATTLNVCEPARMSTTMTKPAQLKWVVRKAGVSQVTLLQQVQADKLTGLGKLQLGKKKKTLGTPKPASQQMNLSMICQGPLEALAEDLGCSIQEEHAKIIEMDMASLSNSTNVKCNSQNIGCTKSTLPPFNLQTNVEDMDLVSHVNPNEVLVFGREETSKSHLTLDSSLGLSQGSAGTISTVDKIEEEIKEDCPSSKQKSPLREIQFMAPLQRNVSCAAVDQHVNSASIVGDHVGLSSTMLAHLKSLKAKAIRKARASEVTPLQEVAADEVARLEKLKEEEKLGKKKMNTLETLKSALQQMNLENFQFVEASMEGRAEDIRIVLEEENEEIIDMDMVVSASLSNAADTEWGLQSSGCTKSWISATVDRSFQVNPGNEVFEKAEDTTKCHDILEPSPQFSKVSADTISIVDKVEEDIKVDCPSSKQESQLVGIQLMDHDVAPLERNKKERSSLEESSSLNEQYVGCLTMLPNLWEVLWRHLQRI